MQKATFFVIGCKGVGAEVAKDILLTGCSVSLADPDPVDELDLCSNAFFTQNDIGKTRSDVLANQLRELNPQKEVTSINLIDLRQLTQYQAVIYTDSPRFTQLEVATYCRAHKIPFILSQTFGLCGRIFCDFGDEFVVYDTDGERIDDYTVSEVMIDQNDGKLEICIGTKDHLPYSSGALVKITDIKFSAENEEDAVELGKLFNDKEYRIEMTSLSMFKIKLGESAEEFVDYISRCKNVGYKRGGYIRLVKEPATISFQSFEQQIRAPTFCPEMTDFVKFEQNEVLKYVYGYIDETRNALADYDKPWNRELMDQFFEQVLKYSGN